MHLSFNVKVNLKVIIYRLRILYYTLRHYKDINELVSAYPKNHERWDAETPDEKWNPSLLWELQDKLEKKCKLPRCPFDKPDFTWKEHKKYYDNKFHFIKSIASDKYIHGRMHWLMSLFE